jgi:endonuclease YncB( thermonuclease family)
MFLRPALRSALGSLLLLLALSPAARAAWQHFDCTLLADQYYDGDSFHGKAQTGHTYIWRLYGADCPETDDREPERLKEQAGHFGVSIPVLLRWGEKAKDFTHRTLAHGFVAHTQKQKAGGQSEKNRYYAVILVGQKSLADLLVSEGLARAYGFPAAFPPDGHVDEQRFMRDLERLERKARTEKKGIWSVSTRTGQASPTPAPFSVFSQ